MCTLNTNNSCRTVKGEISPHLVIPWVSVTLMEKYLSAALIDKHMVISNTDDHRSSAQLMTSDIRAVSAADDPKSSAWSSAQLMDPADDLVSSALLMTPLDVISTTD